MAVGLGLLGRGAKRFRVGTAHIFGGAVGGGAVGLFLGYVGSLMSASNARPGIILVAALTATWFGIRPPRRGLGLRRQVPRRFEHVSSLELTYILWGLMLGAGLLIVITYSSVVLLYAAESVSGPIVGLQAGVVFGFVRALTADMVGSRLADPERIMDLLEKGRRLVPTLNVFASAVGCLVLLKA